jgi:hypothetical protein
MFDTNQTLLIRALNSNRFTYFPTYLGLRLIGDQLPSDTKGYLEQLITRRLKSSDTWRFQNFKLYKGSAHTPEGITHEYRDCLAPSPITALAEAHILALMAGNPSFQLSDRVFSYQWPRSRFSGGSYAFFAEGWKRRNYDVAEALKRPDSIAIVTDIKKFYPSAKQEHIITALKNCFVGTNNNNHAEADVILGFFAQMLDVSKEGIPIGPASSHVLGNLVMGGVDRELTNIYGTNYFRYVDDIVIVCPSSEEAGVRKVLNACLDRHGFSPNEDKETALDSKSWENIHLQPDIDTEDNFRTFTSDLAIYLAFYPDQAEPLKVLFSKHGFSIPVTRLLALSSYSRFRSFLINWKSPSRLIQIFSILRKKNGDFLTRGIHLKTVYERILNELLKEPSNQEASLRRWQIQRSRRVINTLFYLRDFNEWNDMLWQFEAFPELVEQQALAESLSSGVVNSILPFYGSGPGAFSQLWSEYRKEEATFNWYGQSLVTAEIDSLMNLKLYGVLSTELPQLLGGESNISQVRMLGVVNQDCPNKRSKPDLSFEDEFESLRLGVSNSALSELARTRYSYSESTALEALMLLSSEY